MERLTLKEQFRFYIQWCEDNGVEPKDAKSFAAYVAEIRLSTQA